MLYFWSLWFISCLPPYFIQNTAARPDWVVLPICKLYNSFPCNGQQALHDLVSIIYIFSRPNFVCLIWTSFISHTVLLCVLHTPCTLLIQSLYSYCSLCLKCSFPSIYMSSSLLLSGFCKNVNLTGRIFLTTIFKIYPSQYYPFLIPDQVFLIMVKVIWLTIYFTYLVIDCPPF